MGPCAFRCRGQSFLCGVKGEWEVPGGKKKGTKLSKESPKGKYRDQLYIKGYGGVLYRQTCKKKGGDQSGGVRPGGGREMI